MVRRFAVVRHMEARARKITQNVSKSVVFACISSGVVGLSLLCLVVYERGLKNLRESLLTVCEHAASAFIVACIIGLTYEAFLDRLRDKEAEKKSVRTFSALLPMLPKTIFGLLGDIARLSPVTPTLFEPRAHMQECVFIHDKRGFKKLIDLVAIKDEERAILEEWIRPDSHRNQKFLASDIVGLCRWQSIAGEMGRIADQELANWDGVLPDDKGWLLNYKWAAAACEEPPYQSLRQLIVQTNDDFVRRWLLWLPHQMHDEELGDMINDFLDRTTRDITPDTLELALAAIDELDKAHSQFELLERHEKVFTDAGLVSEFARVKLSINNRTGDDRRRVRREGADRRQRAMGSADTSNSA